MDLGISEKLAPVLEQVRACISAHILPVEGEYISEIEDVLSNKSLCPEVKRYIYTILSSSYWIINEL